MCIDEFDKMSDIDRVAIHEVMEQQTVTIAKAGIHASLNARCSVVAAANPIYGGYDKTKDAQTNVGLPDSLLSRFDLLFIVLDDLEPGHDRKIADHVLRMHRYRRPGQEGPVPLGGGSDMLTFEDEEEDATTPVFQKVNPLLHGSIIEEAAAAAKKAAAGGKGGKKKRGRKGKGKGNLDGQLLSMEFFKKYVHYAKNRIKPAMTAEAAEMVTGMYADLRQKAGKKTSPVTPRTLETMVRLSVAIAKARLSSKVDTDDVEHAHSILSYALYNDAEAVKKRKRGTDDDDEEEEGEEGAAGAEGGDAEDAEENDDENDAAEGNDGKSGKSASGKRRKAPAVDEEEDMESKRDMEAEPTSTTSTAAAAPAQGRVDAFMRAIAEVQDDGSDEVTPEDLLERIARYPEHGAKEFVLAEVRGGRRVWGVWGLGGGREQERGGALLGIDAWGVRVGVWMWVVRWWSLGCVKMNRSGRRCSLRDLLHGGFGDLQRCTNTTPCLLLLLLPRPHSSGALSLHLCRLR